MTTTQAVNNNENGDLSSGWLTLPASKAHGGSEACPAVRYLPSDGYYYTVSGGNRIPLMRSKDLLTWETAQGPATPFIQSSGQSADSSPTFEETRHATVAQSSQSPRGTVLLCQPSRGGVLSLPMRVCVFVFFAAGDIAVASSVMHSAAANLVRGHANLSFPSRAIWDKDANDADLCCESWGGASPDKGGPSISYVLCGADGQGRWAPRQGRKGLQPWVRRAPHEWRFTAWDRRV